METEMVPFQGGQIEGIQHDGKIWAGVRRICDNLGLSFQPQHEKLSSTEWATVQLIETMAANGKEREVFCIDLDSLPMWLATIHPSKVKAEVRPALLVHQRHCKQVLADHFLQKAPPLTEARVAAIAAEVVRGLLPAAPLSQPARPIDIALHWVRHALVDDPRAGTVTGFFQHSYACWCVAHDYPVQSAVILNRAMHQAGLLSRYSSSGPLWEVRLSGAEVPRYQGALSSEPAKAAPLPPQPVDPQQVLELLQKHPRGLWLRQISEALRSPGWLCEQALVQTGAVKEPRGKGWVWRLVPPQQPEHADDRVEAVRRWLETAEAQQAAEQDRLTTSTILCGALGVPQSKHTKALQMLVGDIMNALGHGRHQRRMVAGERLYVYRLRRTN